MDRRLWALPLLWSLLSPAFALQDAGKAYELKLKRQPTPGYKTEMTDSTSIKLKMVIQSGGQVLNQVEQVDEHSFAAVETVVKVDGDKVTEARWAFSKATRTSEGKTVPCGFEGKTVLVKSAGKKREFTYEDGQKIEGDDYEVIKKAFLEGDDEKGGPSGEELFAPKKPVKIGESWSIPMKEMIEAMFDKDMAEAADLEKSKGGFTLKSIRQASGTDFGAIEGGFEIVLGQLGPIKLDKPLVMKTAIRLDCCVTGKLPDGDAQLKMEMKGTSMADGPNGAKLTIDADMTAKVAVVKKTVK
ncbi:MAG TPA: hypothetical protein VEN81_03525 [Planctomycetota bacterium]|nr:hypothetical protein [Planctomycetota bacterium]